MANKLVNLLHLRSFTQNEVPVNLESGQFAVNLYNGLNALGDGSYNVQLYFGTGGTERKAADGTDLSAAALARAVVTGEALGANKGYIRFDQGDIYTPVAGLNLAAAGVVSKRKAIDTLDTLLGLLPNLTTTDKTSLVNAINELNAFVTQLTAGSQYVGDFNPLTDQIVSVSASGTREGYAIGALPAPTDATERHYFIVTTEGTLSGAGNVPSGYAKVGDYIISDGTTWKLFNYTNDDAATVQMAPGAPATRPTGQPLRNGDLWYDTANLTLYVWYDDGTSTQWVPAVAPRDPIVPAASAPTPTPGWPLWLNTTATDALGNTGKLTFWDGSAWRELASSVANGGAF